MHSLVKYWLIAAGIIISVIGVTSGCGTGPDTSTSGHWQEAGLDGISVNKLNPFEGNIYAATDRGLHRMNSSTVNWGSLGLQEKEVLDIVFLPGDSLLAAIHVSDFSSGIPSLYLSSNDGQSWQPYMGDYGGNTDITKIVELEAISKPSNMLFAGTGVLLARSSNSGENWHSLENRWDAWGGKLNFISADFYHKGHIWVGGFDAFWRPYLLKSVDYGESWEGIDIFEEDVEATVRDVWAAPEDTSTILITTGGIQRSTDGGKDWVGVFNQANISTLIHSARNPEVVYASGENADGTLFFAASQDFGDSWEMVEWGDSPVGLKVNDMATVMVDGAEILYLATNNGVFTYRFEE